MNTGWLLVACGLLGLPAAAETSLSLREAVAEALSTHPMLAAGAGRIAASEGGRQQAGLPPNPRLILQSENTRPYFNPPFRYWHETDTFAYLSQTLETSSKRHRRVEVASAGVRRAELERDLLARQIAGRIKMSYWQAAGAQQIHTLLLENRKNFQQIVEYHEIRVREGAMAEADLLRVRLEGERLAVAANAALLDAQRARIQLFREMGRKEFPEVTLADPLDDPAPPALAADPARAVEERTEVKLVRLSVEQARSQLRLQQAHARPNLDVLLGYKRTGGFDTMLGGVQFEVPVFNRNQGNLASAAAEIRVAESSAAAAEALVRAEVDAARAEYEIRRRQLEEALRPMLAQADESSRIAQAAYREGGADLLRLLDAERVRLETRVLYVQTLASYRQSLAALETAMGVAP